MSKDYIIEMQKIKIAKIEMQLKKQKVLIVELRKRLSPLRSIKNDLQLLAFDYAGFLKSLKPIKAKYVNKYSEVWNTKPDLKRIFIKSKRLSKLKS